MRILLLQDLQAQILVNRSFSCDVTSFPVATFVGESEEQLPQKTVGRLSFTAFYENLLPTVGRLLAVCRPTVGSMSVICWPSTHSINLGIPSSTLLQVILILLLYRFYVKIIFIQYIIECMETLIMQLLILFNFNHLHF